MKTEWNQGEIIFFTKRFQVVYTIILLLPVSKVIITVSNDLTETV